SNRPSMKFVISQSPFLISTIGGDLMRYRGSHDTRRQRQISVDVPDDAMSAMTRPTLLLRGHSSEGAHEIFQFAKPTGH
ncbi:MAG: hypothetical protein WA728_32730, partial [Xanthobacteraceae bacterium]